MRGELGDAIQKVVRAEWQKSREASFEARKVNASRQQLPILEGECLAS